MATKTPTLTDDQRARLQKAGVDPDQWLKQELANAPELKKAGSGWIENHLGQQESAGTLKNTTSKSGPYLPGPGEVEVQFDGQGNPVKFTAGKAPKDGIYTFVSTEQVNGQFVKTPYAKGTYKSGQATFTDLSNDGKTFYKVDPNRDQQGKVIAGYHPRDQSATATAQATTTTPTSGSPVPGFAPQAAGQGMSAAEEQSLRSTLASTGADQATIDAQIAQAKSSAGGKQGYAEFQDSSPGNTVILKRGTSFDLPNMGPTGQAMPGGTTPVSVPTMTTIDDQLKSMYHLPPDQLKQLQTDLFNGGYYGTSDITQVPFGNPDQSTLAAYHNLLTDVAQRNRAGQQVTVEDVLASSAASGAAKVEKAKPKYQPIDPRDAAQAIDTVAKQVLGRKATVEEQRLMLAAWNHSGELAFNAAQNPGQIATQAADPTSIGTDLLQQQNPQEAFGYNLTQSMDVLTKLVNPAVQVGSLG